MIGLPRSLAIWLFEIPLTQDGVHRRIFDDYRPWLETITHWHAEFLCRHVNVDLGTVEIRNAIYGFVKVDLHRTGSFDDSELLTALQRDTPLYGSSFYRPV